MIPDQGLLGLNLLEDLINWCNRIDRDNRIFHDHRILPDVSAVNVTDVTKI